MPSRHAAPWEPRAVHLEAHQRVAAQQHALQQDVQQLLSWCDEHADVSGGMWLDNSEAERGSGLVQMVVALVGGVEAGRSLLQEVEHQEQLRLVPVQHSQAQLRKVADAVRGRCLPGVTGIGVDIRSNRVRLYLAAPDEAVERLLFEEVDPDVLDVRPGVVVTRAT